MAEPDFNVSSILPSMKLMLGMEPDYKAFDTDLVIHINTVLAKLHQVGVGPDGGFHLDLADPYSSTWDQFVGEDQEYTDMVKTYMYLQLRVLFDPPQMSSVLDSYKKEAEEYLWRINVAVDKWPRNHEED
jgi:hypothetical protein